MTEPLPIVYRPTWEEIQANALEADKEYMEGFAHMYTPRPVQ